jgi:hypothetical protein
MVLRLGALSELKLTFDRLYKRKICVKNEKKLFLCNKFAAEQSTQFPIILLHIISI